MSLQEQSITNTLLQNLNSQQKKAVLHDLGPLLILAGAGSGKTRVITVRIAYLIQIRQIRPTQILAITFTNKAAVEMKERIGDLVGDVAKYMWVGTFHSMFARILRRHSEVMGFASNFAIADPDDQLKLVKDCLSELNLDDKIYVPRNVLGEIGQAKNNLQTPTDLERESGRDLRRQVIASVYKRYQEKLKAAQAMDFDDILFFSVKLLASNPEILEKYQEQFRYILVDEYQDTNHAQYQLILLLAKKYRNLCVVGDDDQSIYSFRGANVQNILDFEKDFKDTVLIKLEQNYRSTANVLGAANSIIANNLGRKSKKLWTEFESGELITHYVADHHSSEAYYVANQINQFIQQGQGNYRDVAILYRLNALSRTIEGALREQSIPYRVYGGQRFYDRKEIKDTLAYLRLILSGNDVYAFNRIINVPKRGIGEASLEKIAQIAQGNNISLLEVCFQAPAFPELSRMSLKLQRFAQLILAFRQQVQQNEMNFSDFIEYVQDQSGMVQEIIEVKEKKAETVDRVENLRELLSEAVEYENRFQSQSQLEKDLVAQYGEELLLSSDEAIFSFSEPDPATSSSSVVSAANHKVALTTLLQTYLEKAALYSEIETGTEDDNFVKLLTIHSSKGLEFPLVFIVGTEEGLFPGVRSMDSQEGLEEERRLAYVAITRAQTKLHITSARSRIIFGQTKELPVSRFVREIDHSYVQSLGFARQSFVDRSVGAAGYVSRSQEGSTGKSFDQSSYRLKNKPDHVTTSAWKQHSSTHLSDNKQNSDQGFLRLNQISNGMAVKHPRFGLGKILSIEEVAADALICVLFSDNNKRNMLLNKSKLSKA